MKTINLAHSHWEVVSPDADPYSPDASWRFVAVDDRARHVYTLETDVILVNRRALDEEAEYISYGGDYEERLVPIYAFHIRLETARGYRFMHHFDCGNPETARALLLKMVKVGVDVDGVAESEYWHEISPKYGSKAWIESGAESTLYDEVEAAHHGVAYVGGYTL